MIDIGANNISESMKENFASFIVFCTVSKDIEPSFIEANF
jgi:hypothetical protein